LAETPFFDENLLFGQVDSRDTLRQRMRSQHVWDEGPELTLRALSRALERRRLAGRRGEKL
jgi:hypothetical protein